ncbi:MAG: ComF family protein [Muribaculaceae bacterium]|nr:ComF family protein [Muribaculaceae bacterium]
MVRTIKEWAHALLGMLYPDICEVCGTPLVSGEKIVCLDCLSDMPLTGLHTRGDNEMHKRLMCHAPLERATAMFKYFKGNPYAKLIHMAKYRGRPDIAEHLAYSYAMSIIKSGFFSGIDMVVPVPLNRWKELSRGYNQSERIAAGISRATGITTIQCLKAGKHSSQTKFGSYGRWLNTRGIYSTTDTSEIEGKHILIVDDVLTTGATLVSCMEAIHRASPSTRISVLTLAIDHLS